MNTALKSRAQVFEDVFLFCFFVFFMAMIFGFYNMKSNEDVYRIALIIGVSGSVIATFCAIYEIWNFSMFTQSEKFWWIIALFMSNVIAAMCYFLVRRKHLRDSHLRRS